MQAVCNGFERVAGAKLSGATYKYTPAGKIESTSWGGGPSIELPATANCLLATFGVLLVRDRWHLTMCNGHPVTDISHLATFNALPVVEIGHPVVFRALPVTVN